MFIPEDRDVNITRVQKTFTTIIYGEEVGPKRLLNYQETPETKLMTGKFTQSLSLVGNINLKSLNYFKS